ncbi:MAG: KEOPS complex subunit Cgi121 [Promethearchaeota archaeon]
MSGLIIHKITIGETIHTVAIFGCTLTSPIEVTTLINHGQTIGNKFHVTIQLMNAAKVAGYHHLLFAIIHALRAFHQGKQRASNIGMEILRFAAAQRQIARALEILGITNDTKQLAGVIVSGSRRYLNRVYTHFLSATGGHSSPEVLDVTSREKEEELQEAFKISSVELEATAVSRRTRDRRQAIKKIIYEHCALQSIAR